MDGLLKNMKNKNSKYEEVPGMSLRKKKIIKIINVHVILLYTWQ